MRNCGDAMSYCRFSHDNFKSEIYAYESGDGFVVHVASRRLSSEIPPLHKWGNVTVEEYFKRHSEQLNALGDAEYIEIDGPYDGETFVRRTLHELLDCIKDIRENGYHVPEYVIPSIEEEIETSNNEFFV